MNSSKEEGGKGLVRKVLSNPNDVSPAASNLFFGFFLRGGAWGSGL